MPVCSSCNREIGPGQPAVHFMCPSCGQEEIWRCAECRRLSVSYRCSRCGFAGP